MTEKRHGAAAQQGPGTKPMPIGEFDGAATLSGESSALMATPMYWLYEMGHAALNPSRAIADATRLFFKNPANPFAHTTYGKSVAAAAELFGISRYIAVPVTALLIWYLVIQGSYASVEKGFLAMALVFFAYPIAAVLAHPDWGAVARGAFVPTLRADPDYLTLFVGLIGTTITPYMQLFQQSSVVEKGVPRRHYGPERADAYVGSVFSNIIAAFIVIATGSGTNAALVALAVK